MFENRFQSYLHFKCYLLYQTFPDAWKYSQNFCIYIRKFRSLEFTKGYLWANAFDFSFKKHTTFFSKYFPFRNVSLKVLNFSSMIWLGVLWFTKWCNWLLVYNDVLVIRLWAFHILEIKRLHFSKIITFVNLVLKILNANFKYYLK